MDSKLEVLCVTTKLSIGGVQTFFVNYAPLLVKYGIVLDFVVQTNEPQVFDELMQDLGSKIFTVTSINVSKRKFMSDIKKILKSNPNISIVHAHQNFSNIFSLWAAKECHVPVRISHSHNNYESNSFIKECARNLFRITLPLFATDYWACSNQAAQWLYGKRQKDVCCQIINNAISTEKFQFHEENRKIIRNQLQLQDKLVWIHIGTFSRAKNHIFLLELFHSYCLENDNYTLLLCGDGDLRPQIEEKIVLLGLKSKVILLGAVINCEKYLSAADIFVFPSLHEGFPLSVIEAQASGLSCIISDAVPDDAVLLPNVIKCSKMDMGIWKKAIDSVLKISFVRKSAKELIVQSHYDIKLESKRLAEMYKEALEREMSCKH